MLKYDYCYNNIFMKQHLDPRAKWLFFLNYIVLVGLLFGSFVTSVILIWMDEANDGIFVFPIGLVLLYSFGVVVVSSLATAVWANLSYRYFLYELTEDTFRKEHGIINKHYVSIPYHKIQNIDIHRGVLDRILGLSTIYIQTAGASSVSSRSNKHNAYAEGQLPGLSKELAEQLRDELLSKSRDITTNDGV